MKSLKLLCLFILFCLFTEIVSQNVKCDIKLGCLMRVKYFAHVSFQSKTGSPFPLKSSLNYKIIYVYKDRLVFYSSPRSTEVSLEQESEITKLVDEANIERVINFSNIILDCGKYHNRLCIAQNYPDIETIPFFKKIKKIIPTNPDIKCIVIPFYENSYKLAHEKVAFVCIHEIRQLKQFITFRNYISRAIEYNHMSLANDRFNSYNGIRRDQFKFIFFHKNKAQPVIGRLFGKKISLVTNDKSTGLVKEFSLYQVRNNGAYFAIDAIKKRLIKPTWNRDFEWQTIPECCLAFPGEKEKLYLCASTNDGKSLEKSADICKVKLTPFLKSAKIQINALNLAENSFALLSDKLKFQDCKSKEFEIFRKRVNYALTVLAIEDCNLVMNYEQSSFENKFNFCFKHYGDEMKLEINLLSHGSSALYSKFNECFYSEKFFKNKLNSNYLKKLLGIKSKKSSFLEVDEIDNEDDAEITYNRKINNEKDELKKLTFTELRSQQIKRKNSLGKKKDKKVRQSKKTIRRKANKSKIKEIERLMYNQRKNKPNNKLTNKVFRIRQMNKLQNNRRFRQGIRESMQGKYSRSVASQGNKNADPFVAYLGFLRDSSLRGNVNVLEKEMQKYYS